MDFRSFCKLQNRKKETSSVACVTFKLTLQIIHIRPHHVHPPTPTLHVHLHSYLYCWIFQCITWLDLLCITTCVRKKTNNIWRVFSAYKLIAVYCAPENRMRIHNASNLDQPYFLSLKRTPPNLGSFVVLPLLRLLVMLWLCYVFAMHDLHTT